MTFSLPRLLQQHVLHARFICDTQIPYNFLENHSIPAPQFPFGSDSFLPVQH
jgi:hypothetical protein